MKTFGLLGLSFYDPNKGCEALTYTFLNMLKSIYPDEELDLICIGRSNDLGRIPEFFPQFHFRCHYLNIFSPISWYNTYKVIKTCDCVFDASYGDGFTGIYGTRRNFVQAMRKQLPIWAEKPLFLLPQTYGKYKFPFKSWSVGLIKKSSLAYARDEETAKTVGAFVKTTSDMAFGLPYDKNMFKFDGSKRRFGVNVSSLLWDDNTRGRFNLTIDYKEFYHKLINNLLEKDFEVHLIGHVIDKRNYNSSENDYRILELLKKEYGNEVTLAPAFDTAIEAKSYISNMDFFLGSRMHSTIGAISSGVKTIPLAYCHKFKALYSKIQYPFFIEATKLSTEEALEIINIWIEEPQILEEYGRKSVNNAISYLDEFLNDLQSTLAKYNLKSK